MKKPIIHKGSNGCMDISFYLVKESVISNSLVKAEDILLVNGKKPKVNDPIVCGSCYKPIYIISKEGWCK